MKPLHLQISGMSMHPTIRSGQHVISMPCAWADVQVGDIIVFNHWQHRKPVVHRVVRVQVTKRGIKRLRCRGDNNRWMDMGWILEAAFLGRVTHVEGETL